MSRPPNKQGDWHVVTKNKKKEKEEEVRIRGRRTQCKTHRVYRSAKVKALLARQVGRRHQGVGEGLPVLRRHLEGNEGEGRPPEGRT